MRKKYSIDVLMPDPKDFLLAHLRELFEVTDPLIVSMQLSVCYRSLAGAIKCFTLTVFRPANVIEIFATDAYPDTDAMGYPLDNRPINWNYYKRTDSRRDAEDYIDVVDDELEYLMSVEVTSKRQSYEIGTLLDTARALVKFRDEVKPELLAKTWAPHRHVDWCLDIDEQRALSAL